MASAHNERSNQAPDRAETVLLLIDVINDGVRGRRQTFNTSASNGCFAGEILGLEEGWVTVKNLQLGYSQKSYN